MKSFTIESIVLLTIAFVINVSAQVTNPDRKARFEAMSAERERTGLSDPFLGITNDGKKREGLFEISATGVSTGPVREAAIAFLSALDNTQKEKATFPVDDNEWRKWMNQHFYVRQGVGFFEMSEKQRRTAFALMSASLSAKGLKLSQDIMKLNHTLGEINNNFEEYGEWLYWITIMGEPSEKEPWGWQIDGHHLIINYFVLGDQVVMTPLFVGSEPVIAETGKYKGIEILQDEQNLGLEMLQSLNAGQKEKAILEFTKEANNNLTEAFRDNVVIENTGVKVSTFNKEQREKLLSLIQLYVDNMDNGHAKIKMDEVEKYLDDTWFAWIGGTEENSVYYYRIQSPVILIEFDHQKPVGTRQLYGTEVHRQHIHAVVRTPNGNDYGKDLLRQHYKAHPHH